jgi:hypothetical protein
MAFGSKRRLVTMGGAAPFSLSAFMARQSDGFFYDFTRTDRHFQEHTGPTLADDIGEAIGLALDQRTWGSQPLADVLLGQSNLISGAWSLSVSGTATATESPAGTLNLTGDGTNGAVADHSMVTEAGRTYCVTASISAAVFAYVGAAQGSVSIINGLSLSAGTKVFYFVATGATSWIRFFRGPATVAVISGISAKYVPVYSALQSTGAAKPTRQAGGAKFDGSDDNLLTTCYAGSAAGFIMALGTMPASPATDQILCGASDSGPSNRCYLLVSAGGGVVCGGLGGQSAATIKGTTDVRSRRVVVCLTWDATSVTLFVDGVVEYTGARSGNPTTATPWRIGAHNVAGTAVSFFGGAIEKIITGREYLTASKERQARLALLA